MKSRKQINTVKSRKQINTGTVAGEKEAADGGVGPLLSFRMIGGSGCNRLESFEVKHRGRKPLTILWCPDEPSSDSIGDIDDADIDYEKMIELQEQYYGGSSTEVKKFLEKQRELVAKSRGVPYAGVGSGGSSTEFKKFLEKQRELVAKTRGVPYAGAGSELGKRKCGPKATKEKKASGGEDEEACDTCGGKWHRPLTIKPPCVPIPGPQWFVACQCCYGEKFEENTGDCAKCGSTAKGLFPKHCPLCFESSHFDNRDKECMYYGSTAKDFLSVPLKPTRKGIKTRRQPRSSKKLSKKQKELAAEDTVVPSDDGDDAGAG